MAKKGASEWVSPTDQRGLECILCLTQYTKKSNYLYRMIDYQIDGKAQYFDLYVNVSKIRGIYWYMFSIDIMNRLIHKVMVSVYHDYPQMPCIYTERK